MKPIDTLEQEILSLSEEQRYQLFERVSAAIIADTPAGEQPDSVSEAIRRKTELETDPSIGITWSQIKTNLGRS